MTEPADRYLRFGCPRCMARLRAGPSQAGTKQRCPRCQWQFVVPNAEQLAALGARPEEYPIFEGDYRAFADSVPAAETAAVADCPACGTRNYAPEDQVGQEVACPDCGTMVVVSRRPEPPPEASSWAAQAEAYALLDTFDEPLQSPSGADQGYIPVNCPVCDTLMHGTPDQVGKHLLCPDCNTPVVVPPPSEAPAKDKPTVAHPVDDEYPLHEDLDQPPAGSQPTGQPLIPVVCKLCQTRMYAAPDQVGEVIACPDCSTSVVVPRPKTPPPRPKPSGTPLGEYGVGQPVERPKYEPQTGARRVRIEPDDTRGPEQAESSDIGYPRPAPPQWPFGSGIFNFLWHPGTWPRMLGLMAGMLFVLPPVVFALSLMVVPNLGPLSAVPWVTAMLLFGAAAVPCMAWGFVASAILLAIVQDTAEGNDEIENWPEPPFLDWLGEFFQVLNSLSVSVLCGVALVQMLASLGPLSWLAVPVSLFLVFPFALLSMLEADSALRPLSLSVLGSMFSTWWAWALFYLETALLIGGFILFAGMVLRFVGLWGILPVGILFGPTLMIYFRLLGRLAWCCGQASGEEGEEDEAEKEDETDDRRRPRIKAPPPVPPPPQEQTQEPPPAQKPPSSILDDDWQDQSGKINQ